MKFFNRSEKKNEHGHPEIAPEVLDPEVQEHLDEMRPVDIAKKFVDPGVARIEAVNRIMTIWDKIFLCLWIVFCTFSYTMDNATRGSYQNLAANSFAEHSLQSTVNVARGATSAAAQLLSARLSDIFGRLEIIITAIVFYVVGTAIEAAADDIATFTGGSVMWSVGRVMLQLSMEVLVADISTLRWRLMFALIPTWPVFVTTWVSGNVVSSVLGSTGWYWGVGMWCIILPVMCIPLVIHLIWLQIRARKAGLVESYKTYYSIFTYKSSIMEMFWILDLAGIFFMLCVLVMILIPLTLAGGQNKEWGRARILAPLCIGCAFIPIFVIWEGWFASHPIVPIKMLRSRGVWPGLIIGFLLDFSWSMPADYLLSVLMVAFNFSQSMATRVSSLFSFCNFSLSTVLSLFVWQFRRIKFSVALGTAVYVAAFGVLIVYRGSPDGQSGIIGGEIMLGFGAAGFAYPVQSLMQAWVPHNMVAIVTGLNWALYQVGSAVGSSVSGAIWTQVLPSELDRRLSPQLAKDAYASPITFIKKYPFGTPERNAIMFAYQHVQWLLCITGIALAAPMFICGIIIRRAILTSGHSLVTQDMKIRNVGDNDSMHHIDSRRNSIVGKENGEINETSGSQSSDVDEADVEAHPEVLAKTGGHPPEDWISIRAKNSKWWKAVDFML